MELKLKKFQENLRRELSEKYFTLHKTGTGFLIYFEGQKKSIKS